MGRQVEERAHGFSSEGDVRGRDCSACQAPEQGDLSDQGIVAGLYARRIVFRRKLGDMVEAGERVGMIKFGSRADVFLPQGSRLLVKTGDRVSAGSSILGEYPQ